MDTGDLKSVLDGMHLSASERRDLQRFYHNPNGCNFLPVARILLLRGAVEEACEILQTGITHNPKHFGAVALYSEILMRKGFFFQAFDLSESYHEISAETISIQMNKLKLAVILQYIDLIDLLTAKLRPFAKQDQELVCLLEDLKTYGHLGVRERILDKLREDSFLGVALNSDFDSLGIDDNYKSDSKNVSHGSFFVAPLTDVFRTNMVPDNNTWSLDGDSLSLARVYKQQGYFHKAYMMLERLLALAPSNHAVCMEIEEVKDLMMSQKIASGSQLSSKSTASDLDGLVVIEKKISYLNTVLEQLDSYE